VRTAPFLFR